MDSTIGPECGPSNTEDFKVDYEGRNNSKINQKLQYNSCFITTRLSLAL